MSLGTYRCNTLCEIIVRLTFAVECVTESVWHEVSSSFDCLLRHQSTYNVISWYDPHAGCNWILMFLTINWKWKWLKFSGSLPPPRPPILGGSPPNPLSVAPKKHIIALNKPDQERLRDPWLKGLVRQLASIPRERQKLYSGQTNKNKLTVVAAAFNVAAVIFNYSLQTLAQKGAVMAHILASEQEHWM